MNFLKLFQAELSVNWRRLALLSALSGASNATVLATINTAAANLTDSSTMARAFVLFALAIGIYSICQRALMVTSAGLAENTVANMRVGLVEKLQAAELLDVENINRSEIYACVNAEMQVISDGAIGLVIVGQALVLVMMTTLYLAWLSLPALLVAAVFIGLAASIHVVRSKQIREQLRDAFRLETRMMEGFTDLVDGFKEVKLNAARSRELTNVVRGLAADVGERRLGTRRLYATDFVASQVAFFLLTGMMVFVIPLITGPTSPETIIKITATVLFLIGPISTVVGGLPVLQRVNAAAESILNLEHRLDTIGRPPPPQTSAMADFTQIVLERVTFRYASPEGEGGFEVGPIDLVIQRGQVLFITGGNGSGKSTLLKLITGLYQPTDGRITIDGQPVTPENAVAYRNMFAAIFSDNHLFQQLYGVPTIDPGEAADLLALLEMGAKVRIVERAFNTIAVSSGQRKRLAMIALLLEHRPICVFDEWAADQDPAFREKFYRAILPKLRTWSKTVIAVTHDDRYFDAADIRVHLEEGRLRQIAGYAKEAKKVEVPG